MKQFMIALRCLFFFSLVLGLGYPLLVTVVGQWIYPKESFGSLEQHQGQVVGSKWIAQDFKKPEYFWPRPSAIQFNPNPSGGSNLSPASTELLKLKNERKELLMKINPGHGEPPQDLLFASASGVDPHISPQAAHFQISRVANARGMTDLQVQAFVQRFTEGRQFGMLGEPRVNVLLLNMALDENVPRKE